MSEAFSRRGLIHLYPVILGILERFLRVIQNHALPNSRKDGRMMKNGEGGPQRKVKLITL